ncbi:MAG: hypothetical protein M1819_003066 [Sarea resinae]|nr:MAG: hypothetical protein M1819_003066 [Sarea resinae]
MAAGDSELSGGPANGNQPCASRADEVSQLLKAVEELLIPFIRSADDEADIKYTGHGLTINGEKPRTALVESHPPEKLLSLLDFHLPLAGQGQGGLLEVLQRILRYSVNTWDQGFLDKLYASTNAVGVASELILAVLNTNLHVYQVSPALTIIEKTTAKTLASLFGFNGPHAGGIAQQGGSASNTTSIVIARNYLFPECKIEGNGNKRFVLFTSQHGHYSAEKAAQMCGFGSNNVWSVPIDERGRMIPQELERLVQKAKDEGCTPFYVNATAGTTVLGSFDPFEQIADICGKFGLWMHVDGSWGGSVVLSDKQNWRLRGVERANSLAINPHKMLGAPVTCSLLLGSDLRKFHKANTLRAGYLFHDDSVDSEEVWDLADMTLQCGRKGDALKLALGWIYYGKQGYEEQIDHAFDMASYMAERISRSSNLVLVSENPPPCLQVCFYYAAAGQLRATAEENTQATREIVHQLIPRGFMIDYAPGERGSFFRAVLNTQTRKGTVDGLLKAVEEIGQAGSGKAM